MIPKNRKKKAQGKNFKIFLRASHSPLSFVLRWDVEKPQNQLRHLLLLLVRAGPTLKKDFLVAIVNFSIIYKVDKDKKLYVFTIINWVLITLIRRFITKSVVWFYRQLFQLYIECGNNIKVRHKKLISILGVFNIISTPPFNSSSSLNDQREEENVCESRGRPVVNLSFHLFFSHIISEIESLSRFSECL